MERLSSPVEGLQPHYTIVVVGSGYGGAIAASRLARAGQRVCVLERGREFQPGEYPDTAPEALAQMQVRHPEGHVGSRTGLYDFHVGPDINVFVGCGLGGTSLVNANVSLRAEDRVFADPRWPRELRGDLKTRLADGYRRAEEMLKPTQYPDTFPPLPKLEALEKSAAAMGQHAYRPPINVTFADGTNHVGVEQHKCELCGDCVSGCNYGAKNTTLMNYLPDARNHGAEIYTRVSVSHLERRDGRWVVHYQLLDSGREKFDAPTLTVSADVVVLGAGSLGSTEILLRSKAAGLSLSDKVGDRFTGNGDVLGFGYNNDEPIDGIGFGHRDPKGMEPVGPCITGVIDIREQPSLVDGMVIEEGSVPGAIAAFLPEALALAAKAVGRDTGRGLAHVLRERGREVDSLLRGPRHGAIRNTEIYLVMSHDDGAGRMGLEADRLKISWPRVGEQPVFERADARLMQATKALGGTYVKNPIWSDLLQHGLITVHPLGGCVMADSADQGVVNHKGQVFAGASGASVHDGLYVCDGAVIPVPLGVNPLLTISAVAERNCALLAEEKGWQIDFKLPSGPATAPPPASRRGIQFTETMRGHFSLGVDDDFEEGARLGKDKGSTLEFTLTIHSDDLDEMLKSPEHEARMVGTVSAPALSPNPLTVTDGRFRLFVADPAEVDTRLMVYRMTLNPEGEGRIYFLEGFKSIHDRPARDAWRDTTTLFITVREGPDDKGPIAGKGILTIRAEDFRKQLTTLQITHARDLGDRLAGAAAFGRFFAGVLYQTYGGIFAQPTVFDPQAPPRKKRPLRVAAPSVHSLRASDGVELRLTRYQGGSKGPVILSHGLGVSSLIFSIDTIETNLLEYLFAHGYDVWLLDFRASIALPTSNAQFSGDDIALKDYPAAVKEVRRLSGAETVQMVVHCFGSTTFFMAMLAGLEGVRSAVASQIATHTVVPVLSKIKTGLHLPTLLDDLGVKSLTAETDADAGLLDKLYNRALALYPIASAERCNSPVCHRITFMYAPLYDHAQLNQATHDALHEMFGIAPIRSFEHLALMIRKGHVLDAAGADSYLPHLDRLAIPIAFIHGADNDCFLPRSTEITYDLLREKNGSRFYSRHLVKGYGHIDCIFGKNAAEDVYPYILDHLEATL